MQHWTAWHQAVIVAGAAAVDEVPLTQWVTWDEARNALLTQGLATYIHGILVIFPAANIKMEIVYG